MKKLALLLVLMPFLAFGQQNYPLIKDGGIWRVATISPPDPPLYPGSVFKEQFLMDGDTSFNNTLYKKIYLCDYSPSISNKAFYGGIREDSLKRVYFFLDSNQYFNSFFDSLLQYRKEYLLYDFSLNIGDTFRVVNLQDSNLILNKIDSVLVSNQYRKRWEFFSGFNGMSKVWVEGMGDLNGLFFPFQFDGVETFHKLTCYEDSNLFWTNPQLGTDCYSVGIEENNKEKYKVKVNPNPTSGKLNIELAEITKETVLVEIYDISGRLIKFDEFFNQLNFSLELTDLQNGIYILNIKSTTVYNKSIKIIKN
jgi:hypothetical protein